MKKEHTHDDTLMVAISPLAYTGTRRRAAGTPLYPARLGACQAQLQKELSGLHKGAAVSTSVLVLVVAHERVEGEGVRHTVLTHTQRSCMARLAVCEALALVLAPSLVLLVLGFAPRARCADWHGVAWEVRASVAAAGCRLRVARRARVGRSERSNAAHGHFCPLGRVFFFRQCPLERGTKVE